MLLIIIYVHIIHVKSHVKLSNTTFLSGAFSPGEVNYHKKVMILDFSVTEPGAIWN